MKEEALDRTMWRNRFGGGFGPVVRQNTEWMMISPRNLILERVKPSELPISSVEVSGIFPLKGTKTLRP